MELVSRAQVFVVIPAYNEGTSLSRVVTEVKRAGYAVVVVDDGSADLTADHAHAAGAFVVRHPFNLGQGAALQTGIDYALTQAAQFVVTFDADGQHRVSDISVSSRRWSANVPILHLAAGFSDKLPSSAAAPPGAAGRNSVHAAHDPLAGDRHSQRPARHDPPRCRGAHASAKPDGACLGMPQPDRQQRASLCRAAGHDRIHRLFLGQRAEPARCGAHPARSVCAQAVPMIAQLILSALLAAVLLYAWTEYRRSPAVAVLTVAIASSGLYFVWMPEQSTQLAELVGIGRGVDLISTLGLHQPGRSPQPASEAAHPNRIDHHAGSENRDHRRAIANQLINARNVKVDRDDGRIGFNFALPPVVGLRASRIDPGECAVQAA